MNNCLNNTSRIELRGGGQAIAWPNEGSGLEASRAGGAKEAECRLYCLCLFFCNFSLDTQRKVNRPAIASIEAFTSFLSKKYGPLWLKTAKADKLY